jgi:hypothetical protein
VCCRQATWHRRSAYERTRTRLFQQISCGTGVVIADIPAAALMVPACSGRQSSGSFEHANPGFMPAGLPAGRGHASSDPNGACDPPLREPCLASAAVPMLVARPGGCDEVRLDEEDKRLR